MGLFGRKDRDAPTVVETPHVDATRPLSVDLLFEESEGPARAEAAADAGAVTIAVAPGFDPAAYAHLGTQSRRTADLGLRVAASIAAARITEAAYTGLDHEQRAERFAAAVRRATRASGSALVASPQTEELLEPSAFHEEGAGWAVNVRRYGPDPESGDAAADTVGLAWLGLPDLQCRFRGLALDDVEPYLRGLAEWMIVNGDTLRDGKTIQGIDFHDRWKCHHVLATLAPERMVLDIDPGRHYATTDRRH